MKRVLVTSMALATMTAGAHANVFLPGSTGIDGWDSDGQTFRSFGMGQGYLTLSNDKNHFINPAYAIDLMNTAEVRLTPDDNFSGGGFTEIFGQNMGLYLGRTTEDNEFYPQFEDVDGDDIGIEPTPVLDLYWADDTALGQVGFRLNYRTTGYQRNLDLNDNATDENTSGSINEFHVTAGLISNSMPLEATVHFGVPFGSFTNTDDDGATVDETTATFDRRLRFGATAKYIFIDNPNSQTMLSGFIGFGGADFNTEVSDSSADPQVTGDTNLIRSRSSLGFVVSHERTVGDNASIVTSTGLIRESERDGTENNLAETITYTDTITYTVPAGLGVEFERSDRMTLIAGVSGNLWDTVETSIGGGASGDETEEQNTRVSGSNIGATAEFGLEYAVSENFDSRVVINKGLLNANFFPGIATVAEFGYRF